MSRDYDDQGLCRYCRRADGEHKASCVLAPEPPDVWTDLPDGPAFTWGRDEEVDDARASTADSRYADGVYGEPGGWR
jgi:hypothetical protein